MSRKSVRQAIAALLTANVTELVVVYDHQNKDIKGLSPVAMVHSDGVAPGAVQTHDNRARQYAYVVSLFWKRDDDDATEDYSDDLSDSVMTVIETNVRTVNWKRIWPDDNFSLMDYVLVENIQYRRERIRVVVWE